MFDSFVGWLVGWFLVGFQLVFGWLVAVLRIQLILMRIMIMDPHWKKLDPEPNQDLDPDPGYFFKIYGIFLTKQNFQILVIFYRLFLC